MGNSDIELIAHLMRRAGFGATRDQLDAFAAQGYEATVETLLNPGEEQRMPDDLITYAAAGGGNKDVKAKKHASRATRSAAGTDRVGRRMHFRPVPCAAAPAPDGPRHQRRLGHGAPPGEA